MVAGEVLTLIILFGLVYLGLGALWLSVMNDKIQHGPEPVGTPAHPPTSGLIDAAAAHEDEAGASSKKES